MEIWEEIISLREYSMTWSITNKAEVGVDFITLGLADKKELPFFVKRMQMNHSRKYGNVHKSNNRWKICIRFHRWSATQFISVFFFVKSIANTNSFLKVALNIQLD